ncbi:MAG: hypothetical protein GF307_09135 [candidate division Zixibacteria bacterium]|nr:hypothetical protein [candidate division Zixibacteria bacterium]
MKTILTLILAFVSFGLCIESANAKKTGKVYDDSIFVDTRLEYEFRVPEGWNIKTQKDKGDNYNYERVVVVKKNYKVNRTVRQLHGDFTIPTVTVFADSTSKTVEEYSRYLLDNLKKVTSKDEILLSTQLLEDTELLDSFMVDYNGIISKRLQLKNSYKRFLDTSRRDVNWQRDGGVKLIQDFNIIDIVIFKKNDWIIMMYAVCEREFYQLNRKAFVQIFNSMDLSSDYVKED